MAATGKGTASRCASRSRRVGKAHLAQGIAWERARRLGAGHPTVAAATFAVVPWQRREQSGMRRFVAGVPLRAERQTAAGERFELNASLRASTVRHPYEHRLR